MDQLAARYTRGIEIRLQEDERAVERLNGCTKILRGYPGSCGVQLLLSLADGSQISVPSGNTRVAVQPELTARIDDLLGPGHTQPDHLPPDGLQNRPAQQHRRVGWQQSERRGGRADCIVRQDRALHH